MTLEAGNTEGRERLAVEDAKNATTGVLPSAILGEREDECRTLPLSGSHEAV
jgi:hypothetical protein